MLKIKILIVTLMFITPKLVAQSTIDSVLLLVEKNNTALSAYRLNRDADKIGNKTGLLPINPEAEFNYLWGHPSAIGNRTDFSIKQSFDFPTVYSYKNQISNIQNEQAEIDYQKNRKAIMHQTRLACIEVIHHNALKSELIKRQGNASQIAEAYKAKFELGEANILEYNKSQINLLDISKEAEANEIELRMHLSELTRLNGGIPLNFKDSVFSQIQIAPDFERWYLQAEQGNPLLQWISKEIAVSTKQRQLNAALNLPRFSAGYMSEKVIGQQYQGISTSISIPLWEGRNTLKYSKAKALAVQSLEADYKVQFYNEMKSLHAKVIELQNSVANYRENMQNFNSSHLLLKALDKGEISLSEYILELTLYYNSVNKLLEMEMNLHTAWAELIRYQ